MHTRHARTKHRAPIAALTLRTTTAAAALAAALTFAACGESLVSPMPGDGDHDGGPGDPGNPQVDAGGDDGPGDDPTGSAVPVRLIPQAGVSGVERINFAIPLPSGVLDDADRVRVTAAGGDELPAARRALAFHQDGSVRSVQLQLDLEVQDPTDLTVELGLVGAGGVDLVPVADTLGADGTPRVWATLHPTWLAASAVAGPAVAETAMKGTDLDAWGKVCDYETWNTDVFQANAGQRGSWLYDRVTTMYRGYQRTGALAPLSYGYREAHIYRNSITGTGTATRIGIPTASDDLKYHYTQGMALHYLLTGDDRFRESVEDVATRAAVLWKSPQYAGGSDFWTERHAGFALLAYEWAVAVSDDRAAEFAALAEQAVDAYLDMQMTFPAGYSDVQARCFAHTGAAHGEPYPNFGCSPWMSAILADGLEQHAVRVGGDRGDKVKQSIVRLGRALARNGRDANGKPYYWMAVNASSNEVDPYDEHWGESAYVVAMAWHHGGRNDAQLRDVALALVDGLRTKGKVGQLRSFNWQCRSAPIAQYYLADQ